MQPVKVNALPLNESGCQIQFFEWCQWGPKKANFPNKNKNKKEFWPPLPTQKETFLNRNKNESKGWIFGQPKNVKINYVSVKIEGLIHTVGFALLMLIVVLVTYRDFARYGGQIWEGIKGVFGG